MSLLPVSREVEDVCFSSAAKPTNEMKKYPSTKLSAKSTRARSTCSAARLSAYLTAGIGTALVGTPQAEAAIITINLSGPFYSSDLVLVNGGQLSSSSGLGFPVYPGFYSTPQTISFGLGISYGGQLNFSHSTQKIGLYGAYGLGFAAGASNATPVNFAAGQTIDSSANFVQNNNSLFFRGFGAPVSSPDFGSGSYMGFKTTSGRYGWMEVTWTSATSQFQILSAAYEDVIGTGILAGDTVGSAAVPEPGQVASSLLLLALGSAGVAIQRRRAKKKQAAAVA